MPAATPDSARSGRATLRPDHLKQSPSPPPPPPPAQPMRWALGWPQCPRPSGCCPAMANLLRAAATWGLFPWRGYCSRGTQVGGGKPTTGGWARYQVYTRLRAAPAPCDLEQRITGLTLCQRSVLSEPSRGPHSCHRWSGGVK